MSTLLVGRLSVALGLLAPLACHAATFTTLYTLTNLDGKTDYVAGIVVAPSGVIYGTTLSSKNTDAGTLFSLTPPTGGGGWTYTTLYTFCSLTKCTDGAAPVAPPVVGADGAIYGTTGYVKKIFTYKKVYATIYRFDPVAGMLTTLHQYTKADDNYTGAPFYVGAGGTLYASGGYGPPGLVFQANPSTGVLNTLHQFTSGEYLPNSPSGPLVADASGNLYGTTTAGGTNADGIVYELNPTSMAFNVISNFSEADQASVGVVLDGAGTIWGTNISSGGGNGGIFSIDPTTGALTVQYSFTGGADGSYPGEVLFGASGVLYGVSQNRANEPPSGIAFQFDTTSNSFSTLYTLPSNYGVRGAEPETLVMDASGALYGLALVPQKKKSYPVIYQIVP